LLDVEAARRAPAGEATKGGRVLGLIYRGHIDGAGITRLTGKGGDLPASRMMTAWCGGEARQAGCGRAGCAASSMESIGCRPGEAPMTWHPSAVAPPSLLLLLLVLLLLLLVWWRRKWKTPRELGFEVAAKGAL
jgi:hypothetical protein